MRPFVLDLDGTLYRDTVPVLGAQRAVAELRLAGHPVLFVTNDATLTRIQRAKLLTNMGFDALPADVITSGTAAAFFVTSLGSGARTAMIVGSDSVTEELRQVRSDIVILEPGRHGATQPDVVIVSLDERLSMERLRAAHKAIRHGAHFIATNADAAYPTADGGTAPGAGALVSALERSTGVLATVVGKPHTFMMELAARTLGVDVTSLVIVGDSGSDIEVAKNCGATSVLVLTGVATSTDELSVAPDVVVPSITDVLSALRNHLAFPPGTGRSTTANSAHEGNRNRAKNVG